MIMSYEAPLALHRQRRGWSQDTLAKRAGVSRAEVSGIETRRLVPSVLVALRLADALDMSVEDLFSGDRAAPDTALAWAPSANDGRMWHASVNGAVRWFPVEPTAAGAIAHDALVSARGVNMVEPRVDPGRTLVVAGCDPLVGLLARDLARQYDVRLLPLLRSSGEALDLLRRGLVHVAGVHWTDAGGGSSNEREVAGRIGTGYRLIHQLEWQTGLATAVARRERTPRALFAAKVRWVNREEGSAARQTFDALLGRRPKPIGYDRVVRGHRDVAATVSSGWAEAGICVQPAAAEHRLGFLSVQREAYELCVAETLMDDPRIIALLAAVRAKRYRELIDNTPGCSATHSGEHRGVRARVSSVRGTK